MVQKDYQWCYHFQNAKFAELINVASSCDNILVFHLKFKLVRFRAVFVDFPSVLHLHAILI